MRSSIDIGSNSILLLILDDENKIIEQESNVTGLGRGIDETGVFSKVAMEESWDVFEDYAKICKKHGIKLSEVTVTATEASRVASNSYTFFEKLKNEIGFCVTIISGEGEAYYSTMGILFDEKIQDEELVIMDIGGASTEIISVNAKDKTIKSSFSMPIGAVRMNNWNIKNIQTSEMERVFSDFSNQLADNKRDKLYCVAGTMTSVGNMYLGHSDFKELEVNGLEFTMKDLVNIHNMYKNISEEEILHKFPFLGKRAATIKSGLKLSVSICKKLEVAELYISTYGLRFGTAIAKDIKNEFIVKRF